MKILRNLRRVVVGLSGGVDSAVAAALLKKSGRYDVLAVFMDNWDEADESGECLRRRQGDISDAAEAAAKLEIPFQTVNFVKEYWNDVFTKVLADYELGLTPNPDVLCNRFVKFGSFYRHAVEELGADLIATGHYARLSAPSPIKVRLLRAKDSVKDQTLFLSGVEQAPLQKTLFPLGSLLKPEVRALAKELGLGVATKRDSVGVCFIGKRRFRDFIAEYVRKKEGVFIDVDTGQIVGEHSGVHQWTIGQKCRIPPHAFYVAARDPKTQTIFACKGRDHPALFSRRLLVEPPHWIYSTPEYSEGRPFPCIFRFQHTEWMIPCQLVKTKDGLTQIWLSIETRAITPGQQAVFYRGDECLGSAKILWASALDSCLNHTHNDKYHDHTHNAHKIDSCLDHTHKIPSSQNNEDLDEPKLSKVIL